MDVDLALIDEWESGAKWRFFFGEDSRFTREFEVDEEVVLADVCDQMNLLAGQSLRSDYVYQHPDDGRFPECSVSYRAFDQSDDYIDVTWSLRSTRAGVRLFLFGVRPHVLT